jgi:glycosyltransferase involved in cell wall biosynthesis
MKVKIVHVLHSVGGVDVSLRLILANLDNTIFENIVIHGENDTNKVFFDKNGKTIKSYKTAIIRNISPINDLKAIYQIAKILKVEKPDLIHSHSAKGGIIGRLVGVFLRIPSLHTPQAFSYLSTSNSFLKRLYIFIEKTFTYTNSKLLASSQSELDRGVKEIGFKPQNALLFNNSINKPVFNNFLKINKSWPEQYICTVGRPSYQKNIEYMIEVVKTLNSINPIHLVVMGVGFHSDLLQSVQDKIKLYQLQSSITLIPWTEQTDIFNIISKSKLYISTARYEGLPYSIIEALSLSIPCVVSACDGNKDLIIDDCNGYLIDSDNPKVFAQKINHLLNDEMAYRKFSKNAQKSFEDNYDIKKNIAKLEDIYLLEKSNILK